MNDGAKLEIVLAQWKRERPDLDTFCMVVCGEVWRAGNRLMAGLQDNLQRHDLDFPSFDVLLTLRRNGPANAMSPTMLSRDMMLSNSAMTARIDKLETRGLIARSPDATDRRGLLISLTQEGIDLTGPLVDRHVAAEQAMLSALSREEQKLLLDLLSRVAVDEG